jgi:hypothetical protein
MKKNKLVLVRETIIDLQPDALDGVAGGNQVSLTPTITDTTNTRTTRTTRTSLPTSLPPTSFPSSFPSVSNSLPSASFSAGK